VPVGQRFAKARERVTKHYQWMLRTDYLPRVCQPSVVNNVFTSGRKAFEVGAPPTDVPTMPLEFSVAAFRLGHSMIRAAYNWNKVFDNGGGTLGLLFEFSGLSGTLNGGADAARRSRPAFVPRTTGRRQEMTGTAGASNPQVRNRIRTSAQVAKSAPRTLSRWRHGFESPLGLFRCRCRGAERLRRA
jgi:hypothetical protein